ncbi:hypothetical protein [Flavobacterium sp. GSP14]|uniref:hypothetical protein n=1 Tax=Flavobacterium sp. GSP14 TaxID=3401734 RepID=UPI003AAFAFD2
MKKTFLVLLILMGSYSYAQSVNDYKAVIVPLKFNFLKVENQYRLNTLTKFNLGKAGFTAFYTNDSIPAEYNDRCSILYADVSNESGFLVTKLYITLKDCNSKVIYKSPIGKSKEKEYKLAYTEALTEAFASVYALKYKYNGNKVAVRTSIVQNPVTTTVVEKSVSAEATVFLDTKDVNLLYAQATSTGYQLIDSTPKVVMKLLKTSQANSFIAIKDSMQGSLILKDNQWFFEYYQNDTLISEKIAVKF